MSTMVPEWLIGTWERTYIQRRRKDIPPHDTTSTTTTTTSTTTRDHPTQNSHIETSHLETPDSTIQVRYIQTPFAFIDIRSKITNHTITTSQEQPMAFAGVTTVRQPYQNSLPLVHWHSCLDLDTQNMDCLQRWKEAEMDTPRPTLDIGYFHKCQKNTQEDVYLEYDPDRTLLEQWVRIDTCQNQFLAVRSSDGHRVLILAGIYFGYADQLQEIFVSGMVHGGRFGNKEEWIVQTNAVDSTNVGHVLEIPRGNWIVLKGSTLPLTTIESIQV